MGSLICRIITSVNVGGDDLFDLLRVGGISLKAVLLDEIGSASIFDGGPQARPSVATSEIGVCRVTESWAMDFLNFEERYTCNVSSVRQNRKGSQP